MSIVKCSREKCNNFSSSRNESGMCFVCEERRLRDLEKSFSTFKTKEEIDRYDYNVCIVKSCRARVFMRARCKKHYIGMFNKNI